MFLSTSVTYAYNIRIGLQIDVPNAFVGSQSDAVIMNSSLQKGLVKLNRMEKYNIVAQSNKILIKKNNCPRTFDTNSSSVYIIPIKDDSLVYNKSRWYRGCLKLVAKNNHLNVVNIVDIEDYIKSVVPSEMPASWSLEALKAQAIAARSYALANINKHSSEGFDLHDTTQDQVYKGVQAEHSRSNYAATSTNGQVIVSKNKIVPAYYHSSSGGVTDNEAWSSKISFVKPVKDFDFESPSSSWTKSFDLNNISNRLSLSGYNVGSIQSIVPVNRTSVGRVKTLRLIGSSGSNNIDAGKFQKILNLPSNLFNIYNNGKSLLIAGKGSGHGVGMSQWGAKALADRGCNVYQILGYYFTNVEVKRVM